MDMKKLAAELVEKVGGKENISGITHCVTVCALLSRMQTRWMWKASKIWMACWI